MNLRQHIEYYLSGLGGRFMFGGMLWLYAGLVVIGLAAAWWRSDRSFLGRQAEFLILAFLFWLLPTMAPVKYHNFDYPFGFFVAVLVALALRSIYLSLSPTLGATVTSSIGLVLLVSPIPPAGLSNTYLPLLTGMDWAEMTPVTATEREEAFRAMDRLKADLTGNATESHGVQVYFTNIGVYASNNLQYYLLKNDPSLDWVFNLRFHASAQYHIDYIHKTKQDFVIAGERDNGFTYLPFSQPAENAVLAALWQDPEYIAIDRFYGPAGRTIAVFQRRDAFAGWRPMSSRFVLPASDMTNPGGAQDGLRVSAGTLNYLQTYAARPVHAEMLIAGTGAVGQKIDVLVNQLNVGELVLKGDEVHASTRIGVELVAGLNDIVFKYSTDAPVTFDRLLVIPHLDLPGEQPSAAAAIAEETEGLWFRSATYGANCGAPPGNATADIAQSCNGKMACEYTVDVARLGDPANGCAKDYAAEYFCGANSTLVHVNLPAEAGLGKHDTLSCPRAATGAQP
jgi:hypothetical protein